MLRVREINEELVLQEILALIASGAESTHTLQGVYLGSCKECQQIDILPQHFSWTIQMAKPMTTDLLIIVFVIIKSKGK